tara:strand:+ start:262 stop:1218 length:957 start_codon:yes stop_codon:yes gene_type:complete
MSTETDKYTTKLKYNAFMGTIAICVLYAIIAFIMILYINLTEQGKALYSDLKPFAVTFIFGTIIIIVAITIMVFNWQPEQAKKKNSDDFILTNKLDCPDYYKLQKTPEADITTLLNFSCNIKQHKIDNGDDNLKLFYDINEDNYINLYDYAINKEYVQNKCTYDPTIYDTDFNTNSLTRIRDSMITVAEDINIPTISTDSSKITDNKKENAQALAAMAIMNHGYTCAPWSNGTPTCKIKYPTSEGNVPSDVTTYLKDGDPVGKTAKFAYDCSKVYPEYLTYLDAQEYVKNNRKGPKNLHRCEWAKKCEVPWSAAGCDE